MAAAAAAALIAYSIRLSLSASSSYSIAAAAAAAVGRTDCWWMAISLRESIHTAASEWCHSATPSFIPPLYPLKSDPNAPSIHPDLSTLSNSSISSLNFNSWLCFTAIKSKSRHEWTTSSQPHDTMRPSGWLFRRPNPYPLLCSALLCSAWRCHTKM